MSGVLSLLLECWILVLNVSGASLSLPFSLGILAALLKTGGSPKVEHCDALINKVLFIFPDRYCALVSQC